jgi:DNA invertase Pin-like site-specific DNA recombinase
MSHARNFASCADCRRRLEQALAKKIASPEPEREQLESALEYMREGDVLVVTKLDRLARSVSHLCDIIAQFERELIRERMLVGIAKAKAEGKYRGRAPTARMKADKVKQLHAAGVGPSEIARQLSIGRTSVFRILTAA